MREQIHACVSAAIECVELDVEGEGGRYEVAIVSEAFRGLNRVKQQQLVYATIKHLISDGSVHAITIKASAPETDPPAAS